MSDKLKPCPFCGKAPSTTKRLVICQSIDCVLGGIAFTLDAWNTRSFPSEADKKHVEALIKVAEQCEPIVRHYGKLMQEPSNRAHYEQIADAARAAITALKADAERLGK